MGERDAESGMSQATESWVSRFLGFQLMGLGRTSRSVLRKSERNRIPNRETCEFTAVYSAAACDPVNDATDPAHILDFVKRLDNTFPSPTASWASLCLWCRLRRWLWRRLSFLHDAHFWRLRVISRGRLASRGRRCSGSWSSRGLKIHRLRSADIRLRGKLK